VKKIRIRILPVVLLAIGAILLAGCPARESIEKINRDPGRYAGKEITIAGHVTNSFGLLGTGVYEVNDGTGSMWVLSHGYGVPGNGAKVAVTGTLEQGVSIGGRTFATAMRETRRRH
jgi:hypothetical protein